MPKKKKNPKKHSKRYILYDVASGLKRKNKFCPKCGTGVFMAAHKDRLVCGKCAYSEITSAKKE